MVKYSLLLWCLGMMSLTVALPLDIQDREELHSVLTKLIDALEERRFEEDPEYERNSELEDTEVRVVNGPAYDEEEAEGQAPGPVNFPAFDDEDPQDPGLAWNEDGAPSDVSLELTDLAEDELLSVEGNTETQWLHTLLARLKDALAKRRFEEYQKYERISELEDEGLKIVNVPAYVEEGPTDQGLGPVHVPALDDDESHDPGPEAVKLPAWNEDDDSSDVAGELTDPAEDQIYLEDDKRDRADLHNLLARLKDALEETIFDEDQENNRSSAAEDERMRIVNVPAYEEAPEDHGLRLVNFPAFDDEDSQDQGLKGR